MHLQFDDQTVHGTSRIWIYGLEEVKDEQYDAFSKIYTFLKKECCWNGPDKEDRKESILSMRSWEINREKSAKVFEVLTIMMDKAGVDFILGSPSH